MKDEKFLMISVLVICFAFSACQKSVAENNDISLIQPSTSISPTSKLNPTPTPNLDSPIRKIDFKNFTYPFTEFVGDFTLKNSEKEFIRDEENGISLEKIEYTDLTNDGEEDAILNMSVQTGGSSMPNIVFVYTLAKNKPKLL